ncbi:MAG: hypothetical protein WCQ55_08135, partial [Paludibacteraceae bacterium]
PILRIPFSPEAMSVTISDDSYHLNAVLWSNPVLLRMQRQKLLRTFDAKRFDKPEARFRLQ